MYDFYPEWGPSRHRDEHDATPVRRRRYWQADTEARDADVQRPDDN